MTKTKEWPKQKRNPVNIKCDSELKGFAQAYCDERGIKLKFFVEEALRNEIEKRRAKEVS